MKSGVGLCVLGLLCLHSSVFAEQGVLVFCDDPTVEMAINNALMKFNEGLTTGHKLAVYQILSASKSENGSESVYSLEFTSRKSDCSAGTSKPWTECGYLPSGDKDPIPCNATVHIIEADDMMETEPETSQVDCQFDTYIIPERAQCLGCPEEIDENSEDLHSPLKASITKYNSISDSTHLFNLHSIGAATRQVVAGFRFRLKFDMRKTKCAKSDHKELNQLCVPDEVNEEFVNCNSTVDLAPWRHTPPDVHIECEPGELPSFYTRRRPPGWSPLRNLFYTVPSTTSDPTVPPSLSPSQASVIEESSEEDTTAPKPTVSANPASVVVNDNPFHCPSKPWKVFSPAPAEAPTKATMEAASSQPSADGAFSDIDLLG